MILNNYHCYKNVIYHFYAFYVNVIFQILQSILYDKIFGKQEYFAAVITICNLITLV